ncbi:KTSC domain-containing protein [Corallococcus exiguus]|uniref:KTSC domain-containing protein n=1 Tax=Corallococcus exiguus TaxID=83462 RepID=UPI001475ABF4|nr:KTSC domain-containing protein [Corallococcus exiguus]
MHRVPVTSKNIRSIGYDSATSTLEIEFNDFSIYTYSGVPLSLHAGLMQATSKGSFLAKHVKGKFMHGKIK